MRSLVGIVFVLGCTSTGASSLRVDLRTDYVPGIELDAVRSTLDDSTSETVLVSLADDLFAANRIATFEDLAKGEHSLAVELFRDGLVVAQRTIRLRVTDDIGVIVVISRDCGGTACPEGQSCHGGSCVSEQCIDPSSPECPGLQCEAASDCMPGAACASAACIEGACLLQRDDALCGLDEYCNPTNGCLLRPELDAGPPVDAGPPDASIDAGFDDVCETGETCMFTCTGAGEAFLCETSSTCVIVNDGPVECEVSCSMGATCQGMCGTTTCSCGEPCFTITCSADRCETIP